MLLFQKNIFRYWATKKRLPKTGSRREINFLSFVPLGYNGYFSVRSVPCYLSVLEGEEGVVLAHSDIGSWVESRSALSYYDIAGQNVFSVEFLHASALCV